MAKYARARFLVLPHDWQHCKKIMTAVSWRVVAWERMSNRLVPNGRRALVRGCLTARSGPLVLSLAGVPTIGLLRDRLSMEAVRVALSGRRGWRV